MSLPVTQKLLSSKTSMKTTNFTLTLTKINNIKSTAMWVKALTGIKMVMS